MSGKELDDVPFDHYLHANRWECEEAFTVESLFQALKARLEEEFILLPRSSCGNCLLTPGSHFCMDSRIRRGGCELDERLKSK